MSTEPTLQSYPTAPLWRRFVALIYDAFILLDISMIYDAITLGVYVVTTGITSNDDYQPTVGGPLFQLGWFCSLALFYSYFWHKGGQTAGMKAWKIRVVAKKENAPLTFKACIIRSLVGPFAFFIAGFGYIWKWFDKDGHCLHDKLSGTKVVVVPKEL